MFRQVFRMIFGCFSARSRNRRDTPQEKGANAELLEMLEGAEKEMQVYSAKAEKVSGSKDMMSPD